MKGRYEELNRILKKNKEVKELYKPSAFWEKASEGIVDEIEAFGIENFRRLELPLGYFVPNYGIPANSFDLQIKELVSIVLCEKGTKKQVLAMEEFLSGYSHALSDYRVFLSSDKKDIKPCLEDFTECEYGNPIEQFEFGGKKYSRSALNYILGMCFLKKHLKHGDEIKTVLEIGGGFGTLGEILSFNSGMKYIDIDIPPMSFIAHKYLSNIYNNDIEPLLDSNSKVSINSLKSCSVLNAWDIENIEGDIDLFVNFISFQEMEPDIVNNYLINVRRLKPRYILLRNMSEGKQVKISEEGGGVEVPIKSEDYISMIGKDYTLLGRNVFPYGYKTVDGFHSELMLFESKNA